MSRQQKRQVVKQAARAAVPSPLTFNQSALDRLFAEAIDHHMNGRDEKAEQVYLQILAVPPIQAETSYNLGLLYQTHGKLGDAITAYSNAVRLRQDHVNAHCNLATALQDLGHRDAAIEIYRKAIAIQPEHAMTYCNLGVALKEVSEAESAILAYQRAIQVNPDYDFAYANMAAALLDMERVEDALAACQKAIALNRTMPMAWFNLGATYKAQNLPEQAEAAFRQAVAIKPDFTEAHFTFGQILLHQEKYREGWDEYEWRWKLPQYSWLKNMHGEFTQPRWQGEDIRGKTLMIYTEQGHGDALQYVRYMPRVIAESGAHVILAVHPSLVRLFSQIQGATVIALDQNPWPPFDAHIPLISLPRLYGTDRGAVPADIPYLRADPSDSARWGTRLPKDGKKRVGVVWAGNPDQTGDHLRSPRLGAVRPLFDLPNLQFFALQLGAGRADFADDPLPAQVIDLGPEIRDFSDTAGILSNLDLMISSCTAPLHLAGALGVPTWGMIPFAPHFLWQSDRSDSPWYPTLKLYRQARAGHDWTTVTEALRADLQRWALT